ncbi:hypothetical protein JCM19241_1273 [Vibrio ishigakensis]|uniref:Adhesin n=1 Tax=Vibrio ishigakensis TaxID=1481914 RepID=A0A0B8Q5Q4_9VIBR|nr:hypothetical protein JCM19241_1273 [Vibrio ishigakensis]
MKTIISTAILSVMFAATAHASQNVTFSTTIQDNIGCGLSVHNSTGGIRLMDDNNGYEDVHGYITTGMHDTNVRLSISTAAVEQGNIDTAMGRFNVSIGNEWQTIQMSDGGIVGGSLRNEDYFNINAEVDQTRADLGVGTHAISATIELLCDTSNK